MVDEEIRAFFEGDARAISLYSCVENAIYTHFAHVERCVQKTQISFWTRHGFAYVSLPGHRVKARPDPFIMLSFALGYPVESERFYYRVEPRRGLWMYHLRFGDAAQLDAELLEWLREAYDFSHRDTPRRKK